MPAYGILVVLALQARWHTGIYTHGKDKAEFFLSMLEYFVRMRIYGLYATRICFSLKPVFHFKRTVPKRIKKFLNFKIS